MMRAFKNSKIEVSSTYMFLVNYSIGLLILIEKLRGIETKGRESTVSNQ